MTDWEDDDTDAPEEFTAQQGIRQDEEIRKVQKENKTRVAREGKERRRRLAQRKTSRPLKGDEGDKEVTETEPHQEALDKHGMLPNDIVNLLAAREKQVFMSDSEEENVEEKPTPRKKKLRNYGPEPVILKDIPSAQCLQNSLDFLKKRKMQVSRSFSVLNNSNQALRFISTSGVLTNK